MDAAGNLAATQRLFEVIDQAVSIYHLGDASDPNSLRLAAINDQAVAESGTSGDIRALVGERLVDAFPNTLGTPIPEQIASAVTEDRTVDMGEITYKDANVDGVFTITARPLGDGYVAVCTRNISLRRQAEKTLAAQSEALLELSTPVARLWPSVLLLPLVGVIDSRRAAQINERLLEEIVRSESRVAILDVTGVPVIDTKVAAHLTSTVRAAEMLGAKVLVTGVRPEMAITLTKLGVDASQLNTMGRLHAGVREALHSVGARVVEMGS